MVSFCSLVIASGISVSSLPLKFSSLSCCSLACCIFLEPAKNRCSWCLPRYQRLYPSAPIAQPGWNNPCCPKSSLLISLRQALIEASNSATTCALPRPPSLLAGDPGRGRSACLDPGPTPAPANLWAGVPRLSGASPIPRPDCVAGIPATRALTQSPEHFEIGHNHRTPR